MDDAKFDRLARALARFASRRWFLALFSAMFGLLGQRVARGFQLSPATCGEQGAVCTLISGCCNGLTCATSAINTSYGICVPGDGGMVATGTTLISPFSETAVEEVSALLQAAPTAPATDPQADRQARLAEIRGRKDARRTREKTRLDAKRTAVETRKATRRAKIQTRNAENRNRELQAREAAEIALGPQLELELQFGEEQGEPVDIVRVTNRDDVNIVLTRIETIQGSIDGSDLTTPQFTIGPGDSYLFVSGFQAEDAADADNDKFNWSDQDACGQPVAGQGYRVKAAFTRDAENHEITVNCAGPYIVGVAATPKAKPGRKPNRNNQQLKKKKKR
jgi:hypothetical protein